MSQPDPPQRDYRAWAVEVHRLDRALEALVPEAAELGLAPPEGEDWYQLLTRKLRPQLDLPPLLVVAVVGGTNIGKSVIFNHLADETASAVSPLAAGTKHPVCLAPAALAEPALLARLFEGFELSAWQAASDPLTESEAHHLYWRASRQVPERLLLLDTPDIDSDARVNWQRADRIRQSADVLVAVLTQQKYNDAAVKQFFRQAAAADKPILVVFNQCDLEGDRAYWPEWLATFVNETGARPEQVYIVPHDRQAALARRLPFFAVGPDGRSEPKPASLRDELSALRFDAIKIRTFRGALARLVDRANGAPRYLQRVAKLADEFKTASGSLSAHDMARVEWPGLPPQLLVDEIRAWWDFRRSNWSRRVHGFYRTVGQTVAWPVRAAWGAIAGPAPDVEQTFETDELRAILLAVERLFDQLDRLAHVGNERLRPRIERLLAGSRRAELIEHVRASHAALPPVDDDYRTYLQGELNRWEVENPRAVALLRSADQALALARPAITVSLAVTGWVFAGGIMHDAALHAVSHTASELAAEAAITGGIAGGGEVVVGGASHGLRQASAQLFRRLQVHYAELRAEWLAQWLERELLGELLSELRRGAELPRLPAYVEARQALDVLGTA